MGDSCVVRGAGSKLGVGGLNGGHVSQSKI